MAENIYAYCAQCDFGIEVNVCSENTVRAEYYLRQDSKVWCYYCYESHKPRTLSQLKSLLAESEVLLASAKRLSDTVAITFYTNQTERARATLLGAPEEKPQRSLF